MTKVFVEEPRLQQVCLLVHHWYSNISKYLSQNLKIISDIFVFCFVPLCPNYYLYENICSWRIQFFKYICIFVWGGLILSNILKYFFRPFFKYSSLVLCSLMHYPIFKSGVHGFNPSRTSPFTKCILWDRFSFPQSRHLRVSILQYTPRAVFGLMKLLIFLKRAFS